MALATLLAAANCGLIAHDGDHGKATSYQSINFQHFHAVPTYVKKEDSHLLKHPLPAGHTGAKVEVHHGGKHDHGYAIADSHSTYHGHGGDEGGHDFGGHGLEGHDLGGHGFEGHDLGGHGGHDLGGQGGHDLGGHGLEGHDLGGHGGHDLGGHGGHDLGGHGLEGHGGHGFEGHALEGHAAGGHDLGGHGSEGHGLESHGQGGGHEIDYHQLQAALASHGDHGHGHGGSGGEGHGFSHGSGLGLGHYH